MRATIFVIALLVSCSLAFGQANPISPGGVNKSVGLSGITAPSSSNLVAGLRGTTMVPITVDQRGAILTSIVSNNLVATTGLLNGATIEASTGNVVQVINGLTQATNQVRVHSTSGIYVGLYGGPTNSEVFLDQFGPGADYMFPLKIASGTRISIRSMETTGGTTGDQLFIDFLE